MTRKYFGTDGVRGTVGEMPMTPDFVMRLGYAAGKVLAGLDRQFDFAARTKHLRHVDAGNAHGRLRGAKGKNRPRARCVRMPRRGTVPRRAGDR